MTIDAISYPIIIGHRGYKKRYPENTMASFKAARDSGVQMIEIDINISKDNQFPVIHDPTLERTTNGTGAVIDHTMKELRKLDAGSWFHTDYACETIPTLDELLIYMKDQMMVNIEVKFEIGKLDDRLDHLANQLVVLLDSLKVMDQVIISSFNYQFLNHLSAINQSLYIGVLSKQKSGQEMLPICHSINAYSWHTDYKTVDQNQIELYKRNGFRVFTFTVNKQDEINKLIHYNVDGIITDDLTLHA
jgi:glycerophosphoryl diester phosphodiesterase